MQVKTRYLTESSVRKAGRIQKRREIAGFQIEVFEFRPSAPPYHQHFSLSRSMMP